jgi:hypothetical protein
MMKSVLLCLVAFAPFLASAFMGQELPRTLVSKSNLSVGPLQKITNKGEYEKVVTGLMQTKGYTREQAEKDYNAYLDNPTNYALQKVSKIFIFGCRKTLFFFKLIFVSSWSSLNGLWNNQGEAYYQSLGYKSLMEGVIGEAEKEGRGDEVKARIEKFQKESKLKGLATITFFIVVGTYANSVLPPVVLNGQ